MHARGESRPASRLLKQPDLVITVKWIKRRLWILVPPLFIAACCWIHDRRWTSANAEEHEYRRMASPDGQYPAIATYPRWEEQVMRFPGQSGDKSGFVTIVDRNGVNYGKIPVPMVSFIYGIAWNEHGARPGTVGGWDFSKREYDYRDEDENEH